MTEEQPDLAEIALARTRATARGASPAKRGRRQPAASRSDNRDPRLLGEAVEHLMAERGWSDEVTAGAVVGRWAEIVGADVAAHVTVEAFDPADGTLVLRTDSTAWATQMRLLLPTLRGRLEAEIGPLLTAVTVRGPAAPSWVAGPRTVPGRGPRDTYG